MGEGRGDRLHSKFFWIGVLLLVLGLGLLGYSFFYLECLTPPQALAMKFALPLLGGFVAWTFRGNADLKLHGLFTVDSALTLGGGYVVFFLLLNYLFSDAQLNLVCEKRTANLPLVEAAHMLADATQSFEKLEKQPNEKSNVRKNAKAVMNELSAINDQALTWREVTVKYLYAAKARLLIALVADRDEQALVEGIKYAQGAEEHARYGLTLIDVFRHDDRATDQDRALYLREVAGDGVDSQLMYIRLLALAYMSAAGVPQARTDLANVLEDVEISYLREQAASNEAVVQWFCSKHPEVRKLCSS